MTDSAINSRKENQRNLRKLILSIQASFGKLSLLIAICDNPLYRDEIVQTYEKELTEKGVRCHRVKVDRVQPSLRESLETFVEQEPELGKLTVVTVLGTSDLLDLRLTEKKSPLERFLFSVQWTREALRSFKFPVVVWVTESIAAELANQAPDFWSWRGGVFEFFKPIDPRTRSHDIVIPELPQAVASEPLADIDELQQQIDELRQLEPNSPLLGSLYHTLGQTHFEKVQQGLSKSPKIDLELAIASLQQAAQQYEQANRKSSFAFSLRWMGYIQKLIGDWNRAEATLKQSLHLYEEAENRAGMAAVWGHLGDIERNRGNWDEAERLYRQSLQLREELGDRAGMAASWGVLGDIERNRGNWEDAERLYRQSLQLREELGDRAGMARSMGSLGEVELERGNLDVAEQYLKDAEQRFQALGERSGLAEVNYRLMQLEAKRNNPNLAQTHYETARHLFTQLGAQKDLERIETEWANYGD